MPRKIADTVSWAQVAKLAPAEPPCFARRADWLDYLRTSQITQKRPGARPFATSGAEPVFKTEFNFCADCCADHSHRMSAQGKCKPAFLLAEKQGA